MGKKTLDPTLFAFFIDSIISYSLRMCIQKERGIEETKI